MISLNRFYKLFWCFLCWIWTSKCRSGPYYLYCLFWASIDPLGVTFEFENFYTCQSVILCWSYFLIDVPSSYRFQHLRYNPSDASTVCPADYDTGKDKMYQQLHFPAKIYLFKVNNRNSRKRCETCLTHFMPMFHFHPPWKGQQLRHWSNAFLVVLLLILLALTIEEFNFRIHE